jgi:excinuclease UvrABC nuclease subunit
METRAEEIFENSILLDNNLPNLPNSAGFVLFADSQDKPIALLTTANIKRTTKNKLAEKIETFDSAQDRPTKRADLKSITAKIYYTICPCKFRLAIKHFDAVKKIFGQNYKEHITLVLPWYIKIDLSEKIPFFAITKKPTFKNQEKVLGPFPGQKAATAFLKTLEDAFRLCRRCDLVNNSTLAASCPYLQMDACVGVCAGKISYEAYQGIIKDAFEASINPAEAIEKFQAEMQIASKELNFEKAAELKKKIDKLSVLNKQSYRWTGDLKNLKIVHIDKSVKVKPKDSKKKVQTYAVFAINFFNIIDLGDFTLDNPDSICEAISKSFDGLGDSAEKNFDNLVERFSIISYFLYRTKPSGLWLNVSGGFEKENFQKSLSQLI